MPSVKTVAGVITLPPVLASYQMTALPVTVISDNAGSCDAQNCWLAAPAGAGVSCMFITTGRRRLSQPFMVCVAYKVVFVLKTVVAKIKLPPVAASYHCRF